MSTACYLRVSTASQNETGQRREIRRWLKGNGITDVRWFMDKASGDDLDRPAFDALQSAVFQGEIGCVVVWKLDRLSRSLRAGIEAARERGVYRGRKPGSTKAKPQRARRLREGGHTDAEIALALGVSRRSVQRYLRSCA